MAGYPLLVSGFTRAGRISGTLFLYPVRCSKTIQFCPGDHCEGCLGHPAAATQAFQDQPRLPGKQQFMQRSVPPF